jgi:hypothetical protein
MKQITNEKHSEEKARGLIIRFSSGVARFVEKEIRFAPTDTDQIEKIVTHLTEIINLFDNIIQESVSEIKQIQ